MKENQPVVMATKTNAAEYFAASQAASTAAATTSFTKTETIPPPAPGLPLVELCGLSKDYTSQKGEILPVLNEIDLAIADGELICVLGASGCGKSTLLRLIAGLEQPSAGSISFAGKQVKGPDRSRCLVFQEAALFPWLNVQENIAYGLKLAGLPAPKIRQEVERFMSLVALQGFAEFLPHELSGGMQQRVALARALIVNPRILLMDEPFAALDAQLREEMQSLLLNLHEQVAHSIVFVTHELNEAIRLADRIVLMSSRPGRIKKIFAKLPPKPRDPTAPGFGELYRQLKQGLAG